MEIKDLNSIRKEMDKILISTDSDFSSLLKNLNIDENNDVLTKYAWYPTLYCPTELNTSADTSCMATYCGGKCSSFVPVDNSRDTSNIEPVPTEKPPKQRFENIVMEGVRNPF